MQQQQPQDTSTLQQQQQQMASTTLDAQQQQQQPAAVTSAAAVAMQQQQHPTSAATAAPATMDFASILAKIQSLEKEKADMRSQLEMVSGKLSKLQESKRAEMEQMMNSTITKWLENLETKDAASKQQLRDGLNRLVQQGDESGVWNVIACASSSWVHNVNQIEQLTQQLNEYKEKERLLTGGLFQSEDSRLGGSASSSSAAVPPVNMMMSAGEKRRYEDMGSTHGGSSSMHGDHDIWSEFQSMMMSAGGNRGIGVDAFFQGGGQQHMQGQQQQ